MSISIIIPFFKARIFLKNASKLSISLLNLKNVEIIFIDDCSNSEDVNYLKKIVKDEKNIHILSTSSNSGPGIARNLGINKAKNKWIMFLDIDDSLLISNFTKFIKFVEKNSSDNLIYFKHSLSSNKKKISNNNYKPKLIKLDYENRIKNFIRLEMDGCVIFTLFKRSFLNKYKIRFKKGYNEDIFFLYLCYFFNKEKIKIFNYLLYLKNYSSNSITNTFTIKHINGYFAAWKDIYKHSKSTLIKNKIIMKDDVQYGLRGAMAFMIKRLIRSNLSIYKKSINFNMILKLFLSIINKNFEIKTKYDKIVYDCIHYKNYKLINKKFHGL
jgi:glycosyltransferase involved in cell wall biosynthesis